MDIIKDIYVEKIAFTARKMLIAHKIILEEQINYDGTTLKNIVEFFGGRVVFRDSSDEKIQNYIRKEKEDNSFIISLSYCNSKCLFMKGLHELGHAFLDIPNMNVGECCFYNGNMLSDIQAELFVRSFIMPKNNFEKVVMNSIEEGKFNVQKVADYYNVDYVDAFIRGKELKYWG